MTSRRPLADYQLDRREVYAQQCAQPTRTNGQLTSCLARRPRSLSAQTLYYSCRNFRSCGDPSGGATPGPFPNPVVKPASAKPTASSWGGNLGHRHKTPFLLPPRAILLQPTMLSHISLCRAESTLIHSCAQGSMTTLNSSYGLTLAAPVRAAVPVMERCVS